MTELALRSLREAQRTMVWLECRPPEKERHEIREGGRGQGLQCLRSPKEPQTGFLKQNHTERLKFQKGLMRVGRTERVALNHVHYRMYN